MVLVRYRYRAKRALLLLSVCVCVCVCVCCVCVCRSESKFDPRSHFYTLTFNTIYYTLRSHPDTTQTPQPVCVAFAR